MARSGNITLNRAVVILSELEKTDFKGKISYSDLKKWFNLRYVGTGTLLRWQNTLHNNLVYIKWSFSHDSKKGCCVSIDPGTDLTRVAKRLISLVSIPGFVPVVNSIYKRELGIDYDILPSSVKEFQRSSIGMDMLKDSSIGAVNYLSMALESIKRESMRKDDLGKAADLITQIKSELKKK